MSFVTASPSGLSPNCELAVRTRLLEFRHQAALRFLGWNSRKEDLPAVLQILADKTIMQNWGQTGSQSIFTESQPKRSFFSPLVITGLAVVFLFILGAAGLAGAYMLGLFGRTATPVKPPANGPVATTSPVPGSSPVAAIKADMVCIPGGTFKMGRNDGPNDLEKPEHPV